MTARRRGCVRPARAPEGHDPTERPDSIDAPVERPPSHAVEHEVDAVVGRHGDDLAEVRRFVVGPMVGAEPLGQRRFSAVLAVSNTVVPRAAASPTAAEPSPPAACTCT